ncbi:MAG: universal stress protein [Paludibacteraceae bacterium]|nr:universal stress protein [Paludibacteraceae bacterium]
MTSLEINIDDIRRIECDNSSRVIQHHLNDCREERRPYLFITPTMNIKPLHRILVPVSMLEEEVYKAEICTYLARKSGAHLIFLQANDYGSKALRNVQKMVSHVKAVAEKTGAPLTYEIQLARKNSFSLIREASERQRDFQHDLLVLTASRDYGLDDILFGPPERHAIRRSLVPVMLVNPRDDLFSLCD